MSKTFGLGILVVLGVCLFVMTQVIRKTTDPKQPTPEEIAAQQKQAAQQQKQENEERKARFDQMKQAKLAAEKAERDAKLHAKDNVKEPGAAQQQRLPAGALDLTNNWDQKHPDGQAGIEQLRKEDAASQPTPASPRPISPGG